MIERITLEINPEEFLSTDSESIKKKCRKVYERWRRLITGRKTAAVLLKPVDNAILSCLTGGSLNESPLNITCDCLKRIIVCLKETFHEMYPETCFLTGYMIYIDDYCGSNDAILKNAVSLGTQAALLCRDADIDYLCLSGIPPVSYELFDGIHFHSENLSAAKCDIFAFYKYFREACPELPIEIRYKGGTAAADYSTRGIPLKELYTQNLNLLAPTGYVSSSVSDFGSMISAHLSRVCAWQGTEFPCCHSQSNSAASIYLSFAVSRIGLHGSTETADSISITEERVSDELSTDELTTAILKAEADHPDAPGPVIWVYPAFEFTESSTEQELSDMYGGDSFISDCINSGLPLSCAISSDRLEQLLLIKGCILICPEIIADKVRRLAGMNGVISYSGGEATGGEMLDALAQTGYRISYGKKELERLPVITFTQHDNGFVFNVYNQDILPETALHFPMGSPVMLGTDCTCSEHGTVYSFSRLEHRECRVFIEQKEGCVSARESYIEGNEYRRAIVVSGLNNAFVRFYPESERAKECTVSSPDGTPLEGWRFSYDEAERIFMYKANVTGETVFCMK